VLVKFLGVFGRKKEEEEAWGWVGLGWVGDAYDVITN